MDKFEILKVVAKNLNNIDYENVYRLVNELGFINMVSFEIPKGVEIFRLRPSEKEVFTHQSQISYSPTAENYGRANKPNCPLFYGSFAVPGKQNPIITNTAERLQVLTNGNHNTNDSVEFTVGVGELSKIYLFSQ